MTFHHLEKTDNLHPEYRQSFRVDGYHLLLLMHENEPYLLDNICPHAGYPMEQGKVIEGKLRCPMHGYLFRLENGDCTFHPEGPCRGIQVYDVVIKGGDVGVYLEENSGPQREG